MTLSISINLCPTEGDMAKQLDLHLSALGFRRSVFAPGLAEKVIAEAAPQHNGGSLPQGAAVRSATPIPQEFVDGVDTIVTGEIAAEEPAPASTRIPGQPSPGHKRRTKAEIAEDEAFFAAQTQASSAVVAESGGLVRVDDSDAQAELSALGNGGVSAEALANRIAAAAQDRADEARETASAKTGLTHDDVRHAAGAYQKAHGITQAVKNVPVILGCAIIDVPDTQEALADAVRKLTIAAQAPTVTTAPVVAAHIEENKPVTATKEEVVAALKSYALKYDGQDADLRAAVNTSADGAKILQGLFGPAVTNLRLAGETPENFGRFAAAILDATANNPFGRVLK